MKLNATLSYLLFLCLFILSSCEGEDEAFPSFIYLKGASCTTDYNEHGSNSHNLNTAWVFCGTDALGVYDMPHSTAIPILLEGNQRLQIDPGFWQNGISSTPIISPIHSPFIIDELNLQALETDTIEPVFAYRDGTKMYLNNDFEAFNEFQLINTNAPINLVTEEAFEGNRSALITLNSSSPDQDMILTTPIVLPFENFATILELNYKNETSIGVFIRGVNFDNTGSVSFTDFIYPINLRERDDWNKVYVDLTEFLILLQSDAYQIGFSMSLPEGQSQSKVFFDNIKIVSLLYEG